MIFSLGIALGYFLVINSNLYIKKTIAIDEVSLSSHEMPGEKMLQFMKTAPGMLGESVIVNGVVEEAYKNKNDEVVLYLKDTDIPLVINCTLSNSDLQINEPIRLGEAINLQGIFTQLNEQMYLEGCRLIYRTPLER